jgi:hypothetical protein
MSDLVCANETTTRMPRLIDDSAPSRRLPHREDARHLVQGELYQVRLHIMAASVKLAEKYP